MAPKHPYYILIENLSSYSKTLKEKDIKQYKENAFLINDPAFDKIKFFNDVIKETNIQPLEHKYIGAKCADPNKCFKPFRVFGFDNVLFYFANVGYEE